MSALLRLPLIVILMGLGGLSMLFPGIIALSLDKIALARPFLYGTTLLTVLTALIALATGPKPPMDTGRSHLMAMLGAFAGLPLMLALPLAEADVRIDLFTAYVDMVSCLTTTGARLTPLDIDPILHLWRAQVGWMGGLLVWITAFGILAPMTLGGFEVTSQQEAGRGAAIREIGALSDPTRRLVRYTLRLTPVYIALTGGLALYLSAAGDPPLVAISHAMSTLSTSGISPLATGTGSPAGVAGEAMIFVFFIFAITRKSFVKAPGNPLLRDRELRVALFLVLGVSGLTFLRHWIAAGDPVEDLDINALAALWGAVFTTASFLTTTGFVSESWAAAQGWSDLETPGLMLAGLALMGGGVATTAGGVKLLRVYALYKHGSHEMGRLVHPHAVAGGTRIDRRIRSDGATVAWVFFMLFAISAAAIMVLLSLCGLGFAEAVVLGSAALTTTGPLVDVVGSDPILLEDLPLAAKIVLTGAMVLGRMEALAIIALLNPALWRA